MFCSHVMVYSCAQAPTYSIYVSMTLTLLWFYWPQDVVDPDDVAFVRGLVVDGDSGSGLNPQVASSPLEPTIVTCHYLAFPQHWEYEEESGKTGWKEGGQDRTLLAWQFIVTAAEGAYHSRTGSDFNRLSVNFTRVCGCDSQSSWLCRRFSKSST